MKTITMSMDLMNRLETAYMNKYPIPDCYARLYGYLSVQLAFMLCESFTAEEMTNHIEASIIELDQADSTPAPPLNSAKHSTPGASDLIFNMVTEICKPKQS